MYFGSDIRMLYPVGGLTGASMNYQQSIIRPTVFLAMLASLLAACGDGDEEAAQVDVVVEASDLLPHQQMARDILLELVEIDTTQDGNTTIAAEAIAARLLAEGFAEEDIHVVGPTEDRGNLVVRYRGRDVGREPILLLAHLDVVAADPADWELDPFTLTERDGYFIGRGTRDDKDEASINISNLIRLKREGFQPDRDIIVALTADEETGEYNGVTWLLENHRDLIEAEYAFSEGGDGVIRDGKYVANLVQATEKIYLAYVLETTDPGGHASVPRKDNAIYRIADALIRIRAHDFPIVLNEVTSLYFERSADLADAGMADAMRGITQFPADPAAAAYLSQQPTYNALLRTTCVATKAEAGHAENALPQRAQATINCRMLPTEDPDSVLQTLHTIIGDSRISVTQTYPAILSPPSPLTDELLTAIEGLTEEYWPGVPVIPTMGTGATDGLFLRNAGIPVYGVSGVFFDIAADTRHGLNERVQVKAFFEGQEFMYQLVKKLSRSDTE
jgi:acetylornithine deacetylase/succinyl-diaminopimelate desuccinylase-like protein